MVEFFYSKLVGMPVLEDGEIRPITSVRNVILSPEEGRLLALVVDESRNLIIVPQDILDISTFCFINSHDSIIEASDVKRVQDVIDSGIFVAGAKVITEQGEEIGKVQDFSLNDVTFDLRALFICKSVLGIFNFDHRIVSAKDIVEMRPGKIIVRSSLRKVVPGKDEKEKVAQRTPQVAASKS